MDILIFVVANLLLILFETLSHANAIANGMKVIHPYSGFAAGLMYVSVNLNIVLLFGRGWMFMVAYLLILSAMRWIGHDGGLIKKLDWDGDYTGDGEDDSWTDQILRFLMKYGIKPWWVRFFYLFVSVSAGIILFYLETLA